MAEQRLEQIRVRVRPKMAAQLAALANEQNITVSEAVRQAVADWLTKHT